jgi:hypothetical protein
MSPGLVSEAEVAKGTSHDCRIRARDHGARARPTMRRWVTACALLAVVAVFGCQRDGELGSTPPASSSGNHAPEIRAASLLPSPLTLHGPVSVMIEAQDIDRNPLTFRYRWSINGQPVPNEQGERLSPELLKRGDQVSVEIWPHDGVVEGAPFMTPTVIVGNSSPVVSTVSVEPELIVPGMRVRVRADVQDPDHDLIHVTYRWWRNQTLFQEGEGTELDTTPFARADTLSVEAVASDATSTGQPVRSALITIGNTPPRIVSVPTTTLDKGQFAYQVKVQDAGPDAMTFSLESAPAGMTIDERNGLVTWQVPPDQTGVHKVRILVTDSQGAASFQEFEINVASPPSGGTT